MSAGSIRTTKANYQEFDRLVRKMNALAAQPVTACDTWRTFRLDCAGPPLRRADDTCRAWILVPQGNAHCPCSTGGEECS